MSESSNKKREIGPEVGAVMPDGTIYAGVLLTGAALYVMPQDVRLKMAWEEATQYAAGVDAHGHKDWRLPTLNELLVLYKSRHEGALRGTFNENASSDGAHRYWSCTERHGDSSLVCDVAFTGGRSGWASKGHYKLSTRPVRAEPRPGA